MILQFLLQIRGNLKIQKINWRTALLIGYKYLLGLFSFRREFLDVFAPLLKTLKSGFRET